MIKLFTLMVALILLVGCSDSNEEDTFTDILDRQEAEKATSNNELPKEVPKHLQHFGGLFVRQGDKIVMAPADDIEVAKHYPTFPDKGKTKNGQRLTIMTKKSQYKVGEEVRVIHAYEVMEPGHSVYIMGPEEVCGEYVDGKLVTGPIPTIVSTTGGMFTQSPVVNYNFEITSYRFDKPGIHNIVWKGGGLIPQQESNTLTIRVTE